MQVFSLNRRFVCMIISQNFLSYRRRRRKKSHRAQNFSFSSLLCRAKSLLKNDIMEEIRIEIRRWIFLVKGETGEGFSSLQLKICKLEIQSVLFTTNEIIINTKILLWKWYIISLHETSFLGEFLFCNLPATFYKFGKKNF